MLGNSVFKEVTYISWFSCMVTLYVDLLSVNETAEKRWQILKEKTVYTIAYGLFKCLNRLLIGTLNCLIEEVMCDL